MKIIVSQIGKQHTNALLLALEKHNALTRFLTSIAGNKLTIVKYFGNKIALKFKKLNFVGIDKDKIVHFPVIAITRKIKPDEYWVTKNANRWFDALVARHLKKEDFDIFIGYENANLLSYKVAKQRGKITVLDLASVHHAFQNPVLTAVGEYKNQEELDFISQRKEQAYALTDYIISISSFAKKTLVDSGFPADRIYKTYLGVNHAVFKPKQKYNTDSNQKVFELYFVGTLSYRKGLPFIIEMLETLKSKGLNIRLTLIGPTADYDIPKIDKSYFRYFPFLSHRDLVKMHHDLDLFIFPSNIDSWAQVVIEAMACGSPVLVSENTGAKDAVMQGGGFVLPIGDLTAWIKAIEYFYNDRQVLQKVGEEAAKVAKQYTWESYHEQIFDVMTDIYKKRSQESGVRYQVSV